MILYFYGEGKKSLSLNLESMAMAPIIDLVLFMQLNNHLLSLIIKNLRIITDSKYLINYGYSSLWSNLFLFYSILSHHSIFCFKYYSYNYSLPLIIIIHDNNKLFNPILFWVTNSKSKIKEENLLWIVFLFLQVKSRLGHLSKTTNGREGKIR